MSVLVSLVSIAIKAARSGAHAAEHETPVLDALQNGTAPVRRQVMHERAQEIAANAGTDQSADADDGGLIADVLDWLTEIF